MNARFSEVTASIVEDRLLVKGDGLEDCRLKYEVRDRQTDTVLDGGEGVNLDIPLTEDDGDYAILVTAVADAPGSILFFHVVVAAGEPCLASQRTTSAAALRRSRLTRGLARAAVQPFSSIWRNRSLIRSMVRRDIAGRYAGSHAGVFWTIIHPLLLMLTYAFVFGVVLSTRFANDDRPGSFVLYFLAGMLPWLAFSESAGRAAGVVIEHANFVKKLVFPLDILPVNLVFSGLFSQFFGVLVLFGALLLFGRDIYWTVLYLPLLIIPQLLFTLGVCWLLAALGVLFRDLGQLMGFIITLWFFLTPICYDESLLGQYHWLFRINPFYILVRAYRAVLLEHAAPEWQSLLWLSAASALVFLFGYGCFHRTQRQFADLV
ncbi:MAG: ABC transporter permease [Acidobacteria bacterium]|nr:ABC transporter permease [Acidobacteriota bacterium]MDA1235449.1 ABC transporter permease [Acidobacteriota bacterium]